jgi:hypothetical protein
MVHILWLAYKNQGWVPTTSFHTMLSTTSVNEASNVFHHIEFLCCEVVFVGGPHQRRWAEGL